MKTFKIQLSPLLLNIEVDNFFIFVYICFLYYILFLLFINELLLLAGLLQFIEEGKAKLQEAIVADFVKTVWVTWKKWIDGSMAKKDLKNVLGYKQKLLDNIEKSRGNSRKHNK